MKRSQRWNTLQIWPRRGSNSGGSDLWRRRRPEIHCYHSHHTKFTTICLQFYLDCQLIDYDRTRLWPQDSGLKNLTNIRRFSGSKSAIWLLGLIFGNIKWVHWKRKHDCIDWAQEIPRPQWCWRRGVIPRSFRKTQHVKFLDQSGKNTSLSMKFTYI